MVEASHVIDPRGRAKVLRPIPAEEREAAVARGLVAYARGDFYLAHEELELAWMAAADPGERELLGGLIKLAAAFVHAARGNPAGAGNEPARGARTPGGRPAAGTTAGTTCRAAGGRRRSARAARGTARSSRGARNPAADSRSSTRPTTSPGRPVAPAGHPSDLEPPTLIRRSPA